MKEKINNNWIETQVLKNTVQWDQSLTTFYPETKAWMATPSAYLKHITHTCNYLNAVKLINWDEYLPGKATVLDIGCGGGWLSGFLSKNERIDRIMAIDSSANYLENFLPVVIDEMGGDISKIETIQGLFTPLILESESVDMIVISSAIHHADGLEFMLSEFMRVLKPNSYLMILNETPARNFQHIKSISKQFLKIMWTLIKKNYSPYVHKISAGGMLYDPYLGDIDYPIWYWKAAISSAGFKLESVLNSNLSTISGKKGRLLAHFICKKS